MQFTPDNVKLHHFLLMDQKEEKATEGCPYSKQFQQTWCPSSCFFLNNPKRRKMQFSEIA